MFKPETEVVFDRDLNPYEHPIATTEPFNYILTDKSEPIIDQ